MSTDGPLTKRGRGQPKKVRPARIAPEPSAEALGRRLAQLRRQIGISTADLAALAGCAAATIRGIEAGISFPAGDTLASLAFVLGTRGPWTSEMVGGWLLVGDGGLPAAAAACRT